VLDVIEMRLATSAGRRNRFSMYVFMVYAGQGKENWFLIGLIFHHHRRCYRARGRRQERKLLFVAGGEAVVLVQKIVQVSPIRAGVNR
jgi:hypothetical protein